MTRRAGARQPRALGFKWPSERPRLGLRLRCRTPDARIPPDFSVAAIGGSLPGLDSQSVLPYAWMLLGALAFSAMAALVHALGQSCDWQLVAIARTGLALVFAAALAVEAGAKLV